MPNASIIPEMLSVLEDIDHGESAFGKLFLFAENAGVTLQANDVPALLEELEALIANGALTAEQQAQLEGFGTAIRNAVYKGAQAAGRVHHAFQRAKGAYNNVRQSAKAFKRRIKRAARKGFSAGHPAPRPNTPPSAKPRSNRRPRPRPPNKP